MSQTKWWSIRLLCLTQNDAMLVTDIKVCDIWHTLQQHYYQGTCNISDNSHNAKGTHCCRGLEVLHFSSIWMESLNGDTNCNLRCAYVKAERCWVHISKSETFPFCSLMTCKMDENQVALKYSPPLTENLENLLGNALCSYVVCKCRYCK